MKINELFEAAKKPFPIEQKYELMLELLKKNLGKKPQLIYGIKELEELLKNFATKNKMSYKKKRVQPSSVGDDWYHVQGGNNFEHMLVAPDDSAVYVDSSDSNDDLNPWSIKVTAYNNEGDEIKSSGIK